jgi:hypothetical protein
MLSETACPAYARYLYTDEYYTDEALKTFQADCARQHQGRKKGNDCERFVTWKRQPNELLIYTGRAYADLIVPKKFNCIFRLASPREYQLVTVELTQSILLLGGLHPFNSVEDGHKHLCVLTFEEEVPALFGRLHKEDGSYCTPIENREQLGFCNARDLPAITERLEKVAQLRLQYGREWWKHDDLSN